MGLGTSEYPCPKGIIPKDIMYPQSMQWRKKRRQDIPKVSLMTMRDNLRNPEDFTGLEYPSSQVKLRIQLIHILRELRT